MCIKYRLHTCSLCEQSQRIQFEYEGMKTAGSPVPVQFDWDKIRTEMKPIKMARAKA